MRYTGSKRRIAKHILPIMLKCDRAVWVEPFVGGGNMIDKVPHNIKRIGYDVNPHVIQALLDIRDNPHDLPDSLSKEEYKALVGTPVSTVTSWLRFVSSFGGQFEVGYANSVKGRDYAREGKRNAIKQSPLLQGVELHTASYESLSFKDTLIYCDPPYQGTTEKYKTGKFDHDRFFQWCREQARHNDVFVSEYSAPDDFTCVWEKDVLVSVSQKSVRNSTERLFRV